MKRGPGSLGACEHCRRAGLADEWGDDLVRVRLRRSVERGLMTVENVVERLPDLSTKLPDQPT
jgi:hypothetical protein